MGNAYKILGKTIQPHILAISTLIAVSGTTVFLTSGSKVDIPTTDTKASENTSTKEDNIDIENLLKEYLKDDVDSNKKK